MSKSLLYALLCVVLWAFIPVASKEALKNLNNFSFLFFSNLISAAVMFIYLLSQRKSLKLNSPTEYAFLTFLGFLGSFAYYVLLYKAFSLSTAQEIFIINYSWPILIVALSIPILKESISAVKIVSILVSFFGVLIIASKGNPFKLNFTSITGDMLSFAGALCFALFSVLGKKNKTDPEVAVFYYFLSASVFSLFTLPLFRIESLDTNTLFWTFINGAFINGISYIFWFKALKSGETSLISNTVYLTPFVSLVFISIFLGEKIHFYSLFALLFIVGGILLQSFKRFTY
ncbi:DMT family transporter [Hippea alviniae]|uniref:DMT family transporter n=1 Tax=Hippea alviniae TaxID=1279027 RepID=UPI0003B6767D|nr:DMT family transporter [Hippea alviniae]